MELDWNIIIKSDIPSWISVSRQPNVAFGHIRTSTIPGTCVRVAVDILCNMAYEGLQIFLVVPKFKEELIQESLETTTQMMDKEAAEKGLAATSQITAISYEGMLSLLSQCRGHGAWNGFTQANFGPNVLVLIEDDLNFRVETLLCLNATVVFATTYPQQHPTASTRVATISWEPINPFVEQLFNRWCDYPANSFQLPTEGPDYISSQVEGGMRAILDRIKDNVKQVGFYKRHTIITFRGSNLIPEEWEGDAWIGEWSQHRLEDSPSLLSRIDDQTNPHCLISIPDEVKIIGKLPATGLLHIVPSMVRRRQIHDLATGQTVNVVVRTSKSEMDEQAIWARRFDIDPSQVYLYTHEEFPASKKTALSRRMDAVNSQLADFVVSLTFFRGWPAGTLDFLELFSPNERLAIIETMKRLQIQGLILVVGQDSNLRLGLALPPQTHDAFFQLFRRMGHNSRIAHFLVMPSSPRVLELKIQAAAVLLTGLNKVVAIEWDAWNAEIVKSIRELAATGRLANIARYGTLWSIMGLMIATWANYAVGKFNHTDQFIAVHGRVSSQKTAREEWIQKFSWISNVLRQSGIAFSRVDLWFTEPHALQEAEFEELCWDCLHVYANQIAVAEVQGDRLVMSDFSSGAPLIYAENVELLIPWSEMRDTGELPAYGFYTKTFRDSKADYTTIVDWNLIPKNVWDRWSRTLREGGHFGPAVFQTPHIYSANADEV
ncbi:hypothetical protein F53441_4231 [Fusarium austroafricanum]|uniref:Uncharacterized protein n=1 Tax=Fusarium austroafricanum TaxID=2364996 RepID=A0A8H4NZ09_9HYPO|nr:hypothetical protein F53441_4231 [Fusarium austroafricanum]